LIFIRRDAEFFSKAHDEIGAIRKSASRAGVLYRKPCAKELLGFGKTLGFDVVRGGHLEILLKLSAERAFGDVKLLTKRRDVTVWIHIIADDVIHDLGKAFGELFLRGGNIFPMVANEVKNARNARYGSEFQCFALIVALIEREAMVDQNLLVFIRENNELVGDKFTFQCLRRKGNVLYPDAEMLMHAIVVIDATVNFIRRGQDHVASFDGIYVVLHQERNVPRKIDVKLVKVVHVLTVMGNIVHRCEALFVENLDRNSVVNFQKGLG